MLTGANTEIILIFFIIYIISIIINLYYQKKIIAQFISLLYNENINKGGTNERNKNRKEI